MDRNDLPATRAEPEVKRLYVPFELKSTDIQAGTFEGYAAVFSNIDHGGDRILPGAFKASLAQNGHKVPLYVEHNHQRGYLPIGTATLEEDDHGLKTLGFPLVDDVPAAKSAMALMRAGALKGMSIGYVAKDAKRDQKSGVRSIKTADILEVSVVGFGMNPAAVVTAVKSRAEFSGSDALTEALVSGRSFDGTFASELALLAFPPVQSAVNQDEAKSALSAVRKLLEDMKS